MPLPAHTFFICYRRDDSEDIAGRLHDALEREFGDSAVFVDVAGIPVGTNFRPHISKALQSCKVVLVLIGRHWLTAADAQGARRLDDPEDYVRVEIEQALARKDVLTLPVLLKDAAMPQKPQLPASLAALADVNGARLRSAEFRADVNFLIKVITGHLHTAGIPAAQPPAGGAPAPSVVSDSGRWVMLGDHYFETESVRQGGDGEITVNIASQSAALDAAIAALKPQFGWSSSPMPYAHRHDASVVRVQAVESESRGAATIWTIRLEIDVSAIRDHGSMHEMSTSINGRTYSAEDIAKLRAGRLLPNAPPPPTTGRGRGGSRAERDELEPFIVGIGGDYAVKECVFTELYAKQRDQPKHFMEVARLKAIHALKASHIFERVLDLRLGPIESGKMHVHCRGQRRQRYSNEPAPVLTVEGDSVLEPPRETVAA